MSTPPFGALGASAPTPPSAVPAAKPDTPPPVANPNPYDLKDPNAVKRAKDRIEARWRKASYRRYTFELQWLMNVLWFLGIQWTRIDWGAREVRNLKLPSNFPRAITNTYAKVNSDLMSAITQGDIPLSPAPSTDNADDIATAEVSERIREVIDEEVETTSKKRDLGFWLTLTGNAFLVPYYDYDPKYGTKTVPEYTCAQCSGKTLDATKPCPQCGADPAAQQQPPAPVPGMDTTGVPPPPAPPLFTETGTQNLPIGKICADPKSPFEIYWDNTKRLATQQHTWFLTPHRYDVSEAQARWNDPQFAGKINESMTEPMKVTRNFLTAIAYAGAYFSGTSGSGDVAGSDTKKQITAWEFYELPTAEYPEGMRGVQLGDLLVELGPLPTEYGAGQSKGEKWLPLNHFYSEVSGGAWGKPRANDLMRIQARRNIIAANLQLTAQRTGAPKLMNPIGSGMKNVSGEAGQVVQYKPITFGGTSVAEPHYLEAALGNVQPLVLMLKQLDDEMEKIAGTNFVTGADTPAGVTAASALSYLGEKAHQAIAPMKEVWVEAWRQFYKMAIELARQHWADDRTLAILGQNKEWQFIKFKKADLKGAVDMRIDYDAMFPKSQATRRANIMALVQMAAIQPGADPEQAYSVLEAFGETDLKASVDRARSQAMREWDAFLNNDIQPVLLPMVQDAAIHLLQHKIDAQSQEFENLYQTNQQKADIWIAHIQATANEIVQASLPIAPGAGAPPTAPGGPAGSKVHGSQHGSQHGPAQGNLAPGGPEPAPIRKGAQMADAQTQ